MQPPSLGRRALGCALGVALAFGSVPVALAQPEPSDLPAFAAETLAANEPSEQTAVPGQALVLYRASGADSVRTLDSSNVDALADAGLEVAQEWDFSAVDRALEQDVIEPQNVGAADDAAPSGTDLRVALVERAGADVDDLVAELESLDFVVAAQPNYVISLGDAAPNDTLYGAWQYNMTSESAGIDLEAALAARTSGSADEKNVVAVMDTGVDASHPDLAGVMWENPGIEGLPGEAGSCGYDFCDNDDDPTPGTSLADSHGTHCAGIIAGVLGNGEGVAGVSSDTKIMALKVAPEGGAGELFFNNVISAYEYLIGAALSGEHVVATNNSWEVGGYSPVLDYLVNQAGKLGILSVFAAGNSNSDTSSVPVGATVGLESPYAVVIASSNEANAISSFSNYSETEVDVALPGSQIMSTVSTDAAQTYFSPTVSLATGRDLAYVNDFSDYGEGLDAYRLSILTADGDAVSPEVEDAFSIEPVADTGRGVPGLKVTLDPSKTDGGAAYAVVLQWELDNPFLGTTHTAQDYAIGANGHFDVSASSNMYLYLVPVLAVTKGGETVMLQGADVSSGIHPDFSGISGASLSGIDTEEATLRGGVQAVIAPDDGVWPEDEVTLYLEPYGIGLVSGEGVTEETSAYAPYALMSGTSMATPMAAGVIGQMAALEPEAGALELRGRLVGSTVPVDTTYTGVEKHTATDGRFDWSVALNEGEISANTWSVDADPQTGAVTVHGYALGDASVTLDGAAVTCSARSDDELTFTAPAEAFDGGSHRIDVTDGSTGRTYRAAYSLPAYEASFDAVWTDNLPGATAASATGRLVSAGDALYFADGRGDYLYRQERPGSGTWEGCSASGAPWQGEANDAQASIAYAAVGGDLVAVTTGSTDEESVAVFCATYRADKNEWGSYQRVAEIENPLGSDNTHTTFASAAATEFDGGACALVTVGFSDSAGEVTRKYLVVRWDGDGSPAAVDLQADGLEGLTLVPAALIAHAGEAYALGSVVGEQDDPAATYELHAYAVDALAGAVEDRGAIEGAPAFTETGLSDLEQAVVVPFADGAVLIRAAREETADTLYVNLETLGCAGTAWLGTDDATGVAVSSAVVHDGTVYLTAFDHGTDADSAAGALYALPFAAAEELVGATCPTEHYVDLDPLAWYHKPVDWAVAAGVMMGFDAEAGLFGPSSVMTRAQMAQVFYNEAGKPAVEGSAPYADCVAGEWYQDAVTWCAQQGIFRGYDGTNLFGPDDPLTREQMAAVLWRTAGSDASAEGDLSRFTDGDSVSDWAADAVTWAVGKGYLRGIGGTTELQPLGNLDRAQDATVLMRVSAAS